MVTLYRHSRFWHCLRALLIQALLSVQFNWDRSLRLPASPAVLQPCEEADSPQRAKCTWPRALSIRSMSPSTLDHGQHLGQRCARKAAPFTSPSWSNTAASRTLIAGFACSNLLTFDVLAYSNSLTLLSLPTAIHSPCVGNPEQLACMHTSR